MGVKTLQSWQQQARYERFVTPTSELFTAITKAACQVAFYTVSQFPPGVEIADEVQRKVSFIEQEIPRRDLYTGRDRNDQSRDDT